MTLFLEFLKGYIWVFAIGMQIVSFWATGKKDWNQERTWQTFLISLIILAILIK
jgi:hypothetical protein